MDSPVLGGVKRREHPTGTRPPPSGVLMSGLSSPRLRPLLCFGLEFPGVLKFAKSSIVVNIDQPLRNPESIVASSPSLIGIYR